MHHKIYAVYDSKSDAYLQPFFMQTSGQAVRAIGDLVNDPSHSFGMHPEDYTLFWLGDWDDTSCAFVLQDTPKALAKGLELIKPVSHPT